MKPDPMPCWSCWMKSGEVIVEIAAEVAVEDVDAGGGTDVEGADEACVRNDGEDAVIGRDPGCVLLGTDFIVDDAAGDRRLAGAGHLDARTAERSIEVGGGGFVSEAERDVFELLVEGRAGVVIHAGDAAASEVEGGEGLEGVVELRRSEIDGDGLGPSHSAGVLEIPDAVLVEHHSPHGKPRPIPRSGRRVRARRRGGRFGRSRCRFGR